MEPQEWCELKVDDKIRHGGETYDVAAVLKDTDRVQAVVVFQSQANGEIVRVITQRVAGTPRILPRDFVSQAKVVAQL